jgi:hypothetical protein
MQDVFRKAHELQSAGFASHHPFLTSASFEKGTMEAVIFDMHKEVDAIRDRVTVHVDFELSLKDLNKPVQFTLRAATDFEIGDIVCYYGGTPVFEQDYNSKPSTWKSHARRMPGSGYVLDGLPFAWMIARPIPKTAENLQAILQNGIQPLLPSENDRASFTTEELTLFASSPFGYLANTACVGKTTNNTKITYHSYRTAMGQLQIPALTATRTIMAEEEILCPYNNHERF